MSPLPTRTVYRALDGRSRSYRALDGRSRSYRALDGRSRSPLSYWSALLIRWMLVARFRLAAPLSSLGVIVASMGQPNADAGQGCFTAQSPGGQHETSARAT